MVYLVDDELIVREGLAWLLRSRRLLSEGYESADAFAEKVAQECQLDEGWPRSPSCVMLDIRMPRTSGLMLFDDLARRGLLTTLPVIFLTGHSDVPTAVAAIKRGAFDFMEKPFSNNALVDRVQEALASSSGAIIERLERDNAKRRLCDLTAREADVMWQLCAGHANKEIARALDISFRTVEVHRASLYDKLKVKSVLELSNFLRALKLLDADGHPHRSQPRE